MGTTVKVTNPGRDTAVSMESDDGPASRVTVKLVANETYSRYGLGGACSYMSISFSDDPTWGVPRPSAKKTAKRRK